MVLLLKHFQVPSLKNGSLGSNWTSYCRADLARPRFPGHEPRLWAFWRAINGGSQAALCAPRGCGEEILPALPSMNAPYANLLSGAQAYT
eukprot:6087170-Pleurochrysis_carterae.AAC.3